MEYFTYKIRRNEFVPVENVTAFFDVIGFTKKSDNKKLKDVTRDINAVMLDAFRELRWDEERDEHGRYINNDLILIPTGDGFGIGFAPAIKGKVFEYVEELYTELKRRGVTIRMGLNEGPNFYYIDINETLNLVGWGINFAARTMSVASPGQILVNAPLALPIANSSKKKELRYIGNYGVKHGVTVEVYNFYKRNCGISHKEAMKLFEETRHGNQKGAR